MLRRPHKAGSVVIAANAPGNDVYYAATVQRTLTINKENQAITFEMIQQKKSGDPPFSVSAIASSGLSVQILSSDESVASVNGMTITILKGGEITLTANQTGDENYLPASPVTRPLKIVNVIVMVNEIDTSSASVYPNPGKGLFSISEASRFDGGTCSIISSDGTLKDQLQVTLNQGTMDLNLTKLVAGLYLIRIENGKQKGYFKVIKE